ncbi:MAG: transcriptional regulator [Alphaproteobacteria bacterium PA2]|nr:MAG: transcriptional regulator [Alphaproteobacteria bacterium PA2]
MLQITVTSLQDGANCPIRNVLAMVSGKWQTLILLALADGPLRFSAIKRAIGDITQRVLTENLRLLERDGYLVRTVVATSPVQVSYELTAFGDEFVTLFMPLAGWAEGALPRVVRARADYDQRKARDQS